jgi:FkbM family methyltransferase
MKLAQRILQIADSALAVLGIKAIKLRHFDLLTAMKSNSLKYELLSWMPDRITEVNFNHFDARSQLGQDLLALASSKFARNGYFVEFGATDGRFLSNTLVLEESFGWNGILAEPSPQWHAELCENRSCHIDNRAVWSETGVELEFFDATSPELSTIGDFATHDNHSRKLSSAEKVITVSLVDLLDQYQAPSFIDYLSVDTEGSEFEVLKSFDFSKYRFGLITVEHNFTPMRQQLHDLLTSNGYKRILTTYSVFDDWYVPVSETVPDHWL